MLATPWEAVFSDPDWLFELKWDGVRCLLSSDGSGVRLHSRRGTDMTQSYPEFAAADLPVGVVLDGEIVALDDAGKPSFELLQSRVNTLYKPRPKPVHVNYVVFDILHEGGSLIGCPLDERIGRLDRMELPAPLVLGERFETDSEAVWDFVISEDLEGLVAKRRSSRYQPGVRSPDWRKIGNFKQLRAVIGGFTEGTSSRASTFGALLLGLWVGDRLRWIGAVGSGFKERDLVAVREALDQMRVDESPFLPDDEMPLGATWVQPQLVAMVRYKQWTLAQRIRAPSFKGFADTPAPVATWDAEGPVGG